MHTRWMTIQFDNQIPKLALATAGNLMWCTAPGRPLRQRKGAAMEYPRAVAMSACHHERPATIPLEAMANVLTNDEMSFRILERGMSCTHH